MLEQILGSCFSKIGQVVGELLADCGRSALYLNSNLETLKRNVDSLRSKASDVMTEIEYAELSGKRKRKTEVEDWLKQVETFQNGFLRLENEVESKGLISRFQLGGEVKKLKERVDELAQQSQNLGELVLDIVIDGKRGHEFLTKRLVGEAFERNAEIIWKRLVNDEVKSIGIYGMGGVGKTTLTKHIHNRLVRETQDSVLWVTVSQVRNINKLQDEIALALDINISDEDNEDKRAASLHGALSQRKNFVMVLDDVWGNIDLEKLGDPLGVEGGRLMITTRSLEVCRHIGCREVVEVNILSEDEAWELFSETIAQEVTLSRPIQEVAKSMAKVCDGLPLGIITIAGGMRGETDVRVWRDAFAELNQSVMGQHEMEDKVFKVLKYSFDRLDPNHQRQRKNNWFTELQLCFLYCSLYPEDYRIQRKELIRKLISEELVGQRNRMKEQVDKGHSILNKLVNVCLLEMTRNYEDEDCVKMHDLVRAMALRITKGKTMVIAGDISVKKIPNEGKWTKDLGKVSLMRNDIKVVPDGTSPNCPNLSTLLLDWNKNLQYLADSFFSRMHNLNTLDLSYTDISELPNSVSELENLKALILHMCEKLVKVTYLGKMKALEELELSFTSISEVPQGMEKLVNIKRLLMYRVNRLKRLPRGLLPNFTYLQRLHLPFEIEAPLEELERLEELEEYNGRVESVRDYNRFMKSQQRKEVGAFYYSIVVGEQQYAYGELTDYNKRVVLYKINLKRGDQEKDVIALAHDIQNLVIECCDGVSECLADDLPLKSIQALEISWCEGVECIMRKNNVSSVLSSGPLFSSLTKLVIWGCVKMKKLGIPASQLSNLESLSVLFCAEMEEIIQEDEYDTAREGEARGNGINNNNYNNKSYVSLPKLRLLDLNKLPRLKSICKATIECSSIDIITLTGCPLLEKQPLRFPSITDVVVLGGHQPFSYSPPPSLRAIWVPEDEEEWWESMEWDHPSHKLLVSPLLQFYKT